LTAEDLKNIGLPIGPSRQLYALILRLKQSKRNGKLQIPQDSDDSRKKQGRAGPKAGNAPSKEEEESIFQELREAAGRPRSPEPQKQPQILLKKKEARPRQIQEGEEEPGIKSEAESTLTQNSLIE